MREHSRSNYDPLSELRAHLSIEISGLLSMQTPAVKKCQENVTNSMIRPVRLPGQLCLQQVVTVRLLVDYIEQRLRGEPSRPRAANPQETDRIGWR